MVLTMSKGAGKFPLFCFYGDDFTGSTDSMEVFARHGVRTVLFLEPPTPELLKERFPDIDCFGIAGITRSLDKEKIEMELDPVFEKLLAFQPIMIHYKVCSTFDSSSKIGSIGEVIKVALKHFDSQNSVPLLVGAPALKRYTVFGNHFATVGEETYRLDRHPTMSKHPVTPMKEADLRLHLQEQIDRPVELMSVLELDGDYETVLQHYENKKSGQPNIILFDAIDEERLATTGKIIWEEAIQNKPLFVVGSSGIQYALTAHWNQVCDSEENQTKVQFESAPSVDQILVLSGSCSPVTKEQIYLAMEHGFAGLKVPVPDLINPQRKEQAFQQLFAEAKDILAMGKSLIIYSALGSEDPDALKVNEALRSQEMNSYQLGEFLGRQLGKLAKELIQSNGLKRIIFAGGDTSSYATKELGILGLEMLAPIAPGAPLCKVYSNHDILTGLQLSLKGGQLGQKDYFSRVLEGRVEI